MQRLLLDTLNPTFNGRAVIVGGGPVGLFLGIKLKQQGIADVVVIEPRTDYVRSGDFIDCVFDLVSSLLQLPIEPSSSHHIKDVERQLFAHAKNLGIKIISKKFSGLVSGGIQVTATDSKDGQEIISCGIVIDCSGTQRAVIREVNRLYPNAFDIKPTGNIPQKHYIFARTIMTPYYVSDTYMRKQCSLTRYQQAMQTFRRLGWTHAALPWSYINRFHKQKCHLYFQAPPELKNESQQKEWLETINKLRAGETAPPLKYIHPSRKYGNKKPSISLFTVEPCEVSPLCYIGSKNEPIVFHAGDATADVPFYLGRGFIWGMCRAVAFTNALTVTNGAVSIININQYEQKVLEIMRIRRNEINNFYRETQERFDLGINMAMSWAQQAMQYYQQGQSCLKRFHSEEKDLSPRNIEESVGQSINLFMKAADETPIGNPQIDSILRVLVSLAELMNQRGTEKFRNNKLAIAYKFFTLALAIYDYFSYQYPEFYQRLNLKQVKVNVLSDAVSCSKKYESQLSLQKVNDQTGFFGYCQRRHKKTDDKRPATAILSNITLTVSSDEPAAQGTSCRQIDMNSAAALRERGGVVISTPTTTPSTIPTTGIVPHGASSAAATPR